MRIRIGGQQRNNIPVIVFFVVVSCSRSPESQEVYNRAKGLIESNQLDEAAAYLDPQIASGRWSSSSAESWQLRLLRATATPNPKKLEELMSAAPAPTDELLAAERLMNLGLAALRQERLSEAKTDLDEALRVAVRRQAGHLEAEILLREAAYDLTAGQVSQTELALKRGIELAAASHDELLLARCLGQMSFVMSRGNRWDDAIVWGIRARDKFEKLNHRSNLTASIMNLGMYHRMLGDWDQGKGLLELADARAAKDPDFLNRSGIHLELGNGYSDVGDHQKAVEYYSQSVALSQTKIQRAKALTNLAKAYIDLKRFREAEPLNDRAQILFKEAESGDVDQLHVLLTRALIAQGERNFAVAEGIYRDVIARSAANVELNLAAATKLVSLYADWGTVQKAEAAYVQADGLAERQRRAMKGDSFRIFTFDTLNQDYVQYLADSGKKERSLEIADSSRARALGDSLGVGIGHVDARQISRSSGRTILYYSVGRKKSFLWVILPSSITMHALPPEAEIRKQVDEFYKRYVSGVRQPEAGSKGPREILFDMILKPAAGSVKGGDSLLIVPDGPLHSINFETLPSFSGKLYLIEDHEIEIAPSLRLLRRATVASRKKVLLAVGAPDRYPVNYVPLPNAGREMDAVAKAFPANGAIRLEGATASRKQYLDTDASKFTHLHFAIHATANRINPLESALILRDNPDGYRVTALEIAGRRLTAELVTLSACHSAGARALAGEGLVGISRAFLQAGAKRVVGGLWDADDKAAALLFERMYAGIAADLPPGQALREAKLSMLGTAYHKPYYWGPWQLYVSTLQ